MASHGDELSASQLLGKGLMLLEDNLLHEAHNCFQKAFSANPSIEIIPAIQSYLGYTTVMVEGRENEGLRLLHTALNQEFYRPDFFINLGKVYLEKKRNRKQALNAFYSGLKYSPNDPAILKILREIGVRKVPPLKFLPRRNFINRWLGKKLRKSRYPRPADPRS